MIKRKKFVEDHYDDLGDDLSGLGGDLEYHLADIIIAPPTKKKKVLTASMRNVFRECLHGGFGEKDLFLNVPRTL